MKLKGGSRRIYLMLKDGWSIPQERIVRGRRVVTMSKDGREITVKYKHALKALECMCREDGK